MHKYPLFPDLLENQCKSIEYFWEKGILEELELFSSIKWKIPSTGVIGTQTSFESSDLSSNYKEECKNLMNWDLRRNRRWSKHSLPVNSNTLQDLPSSSLLKASEGLLRINYLILHGSKFLLKPPQSSQIETMVLQKTYSAGLYIPLEIREFSYPSLKLWFYFGDLPLMTERGNFVINGASRVLVNQIIRCPGIYFKVRLDEKNRRTYIASFLSEYGSWLRIETDKLRPRLWVRIDKSPRFPVDLLLKAFGFSSNKTKRKIEGHSSSYESKKELTFTGFQNTKDYLKWPLSNGTNNSRVANSSKNFLSMVVSASETLWKKCNPGRWTTPLGYSTFFYMKFFNPKRYSLGQVGRQRINKRLGRKLNSANSKERLETQKIFEMEQNFKNRLAENTATELSCFSSAARDSLNSEKAQLTRLQGRPNLGLRKGSKIGSGIRHILFNSREGHNPLLQIQRPNAKKPLTYQSKNRGVGNDPDSFGSINNELTFETRKPSAEICEIPTLTPEDILLALDYLFRLVASNNRWTTPSLKRKVSALNNAKSVSNQDLILNQKSENRNTLEYFNRTERFLPSSELIDSQVKNTDPRDNVDWRLRPNPIVIEPTLDDIDHLKNRRIRLPGETLQNQFRLALSRVMSTVSARTSSITTFGNTENKIEQVIIGKSSIEREKRNELLNVLGNSSGDIKNPQFSVLYSSQQKKIQSAKIVQLFGGSPPQAFVSTLRELFNTSQLSQYMDQTNPLAEITHLRRLSSLGPGGVTRDQAGFAVREIHPSHFGRICPIETPEGQNAGLVGSLASYARLSSYGFLLSPAKVLNSKKRKALQQKVAKKQQLSRFEITGLRKNDRFSLFLHKSFLVHKNKRENQTLDYFLFSSEVEDEISLCTADIGRQIEGLENKGAHLLTTFPARYKQEFQQKTSISIQFTGISPVQMISVATSLIPFLEHDDANRALMGSNMQRQAVPLLKPEKPFVGTGLEVQTARDSSTVKLAHQSGLVTYVDRNSIILEGTESGQCELKSTNLPLYPYSRSNQNTCIRERPAVEVGEWVSKGDLLTDGSATEGGELSLGKNILLAYMPWEGYNFEDAIVINSRLIKEDIYTSLHIERYEIDTRNLSSFIHELKGENSPIRLNSSNEENMSKKTGTLNKDQLKENFLFEDIGETNNFEPGPLELERLSFTRNSQSRDENDESVRVKTISSLQSYPPELSSQPSDLIDLHVKTLNTSTSVFKFLPQNGKEYLIPETELNYLSSLNNGEKVFAEISKQTELDDLGIIKIGSWVNEGDILVGKIKAKLPLGTERSLRTIIPVTTRNGQTEFMKGEMGLSDNENTILNSESLQRALVKKNSSKKIVSLTNPDQFLIKEETLSNNLSSSSAEKKLLSLSDSVDTGLRSESGPEKNLDIKSGTDAFTSHLEDKIPSETSSPKEKYLTSNRRRDGLLNQSSTKNSATPWLRRAEYKLLVAIFKQGSSVSGGIKFRNRGIQDRFLMSDKQREIGKKNIENKKNFLINKDASLSESLISDSVTIESIATESATLNQKKLLKNSESKNKPLQKNFSLSRKALLNLSRQALLKAIQHGFEFQNTSLRAGIGLYGRVIDRILPPQFATMEIGSSKFSNLRIDQHNVRAAPQPIQLFIAHKKRIQLGDKMSGRHGNKGIVSLILSSQDMPYLQDGTPIDVILNPLGVPSRMNVGQVLETLFGLAAKALKQTYRLLPFDEMYAELSNGSTSRNLVYTFLRRARSIYGNEGLWFFDPNNPGKTHIFDGRTGEIFHQPVLVGYSYMFKLIHLVDDKLHARSTGPYSLVTQQPLGGRSKKGGQRLGEMEVWALEGFGAAALLQEFLTVKSDEIYTRNTFLLHLMKRKRQFFRAVTVFPQKITQSCNLVTENKVKASNSQENAQKVGKMKAYFNTLSRTNQLEKRGNKRGTIAKYLEKSSLGSTQEFLDKSSRILTQKSMYESTKNSGEESRSAESNSTGHVKSLSNRLQNDFLGFRQLIPFSVKPLENISFFDDTKIDWKNDTKPVHSRLKYRKLSREKTTLDFSNTLTPTIKIENLALQKQSPILQASRILIRKNFKSLKFEFSNIHDTLKTGANGSLPSEFKIFSDEENPLTLAPPPPESFRVLVNELQSLCLSLYYNPDFRLSYPSLLGWDGPFVFAGHTTKSK